MEMIRIVPRKGEDEELFDVEKELGRDVTSVFGKSSFEEEEGEGKKAMNMSGNCDRERVGTVEKRKSRERRG